MNITINTTTPKIIQIVLQTNINSSDQMTG